MELPDVAKSLVKTDWSRAIMTGSLKRVPNSRFWISEVFVRFSDPTNAI
jgi:hypothetical protein